MKTLADKKALMKALKVAMQQKDFYTKEVDRITKLLEKK